MFGVQNPYGNAIGDLQGGLIPNFVGEWGNQ
jgi:hypothetical protein